MQKSLILIASLALGGAAVAQDMPASNGGTAPTGTDATMPNQSMTPGQSTQTPAETGSTPSESSQTPSAQAPDSTMSPGTSGSTMPSGGMSSGSMSSGSMSSGSGGSQMAATDTSNYPKCSRTVTDKCVQAGGMGHSTMHHRPH